MGLAGKIGIGTKSRGVGLGEGLADGLGLAEGLGEALGEGLADGLGLAEGLGEAPPPPPPPPPPLPPEEHVPEGVIVTVWVVVEVRVKLEELLVQVVSTPRELLIFCLWSEVRVIVEPFSMSTVR